MDRRGWWQRSAMALSVDGAWLATTRSEGSASGDEVWLSRWDLDAAGLPGETRLVVAPGRITQLAIGGRTKSGGPRWLAASTHPGAEEIVAEVHTRLAARASGLLTVLAPRHPDRGPAIATALAADALEVVLRSSGQPITQLKVMPRFFSGSAGPKNRETTATSRTMPTRALGRAG